MKSFHAAYCAALVLALLLAPAMTLHADATEEHASLSDFIGEDIGDVTRARGNIAGVLQNLPRTLRTGSGALTSSLKKASSDTSAGPSSFGVQGS